MRKLFAILLFCCFFLVTAGYHLLYCFRIAEAKQEMKNFLIHSLKEDVTEFYFSEAEMAQLNWEETNEFRYQGKMYDVINLEKKEGRILIRCVSDTKETALLDNYFKTHRQTSENSSSHAILKLIASPYLPSSVALLHVTGKKTEKDFAGFSSNLPSAERRIPTPPPQVCSFS